jgi:hypothetical protein
MTALANSNRTAVTVRGVSFCQFLLLPNTGQHAELLNCHFFVSGAELIREMLFAAKCHLVSPAKALPIPGPSSIVELGALDRKTPEKPVGVTAIRSCRRPECDTSDQNLRSFSNGIIGFCDFPSWQAPIGCKLIGIGSDNVLVALTRHPASIGQRVHAQPRSNTVLLIEANALRDNKLHCQLSTLSCEKAALDLRGAFASAGGRSELSKVFAVAEHVIITLTPTAALYCHLEGDGKRSLTDTKIYLVYVPAEGYALPESLGTCIDSCYIMTAGMILALSERNTQASFATRVNQAAKRGIAHVLRQKKLGYNAMFGEAGAQAARDAWLKALFDKKLDKTEKDVAKDVLLRFPDEDKRPGDWSLLQQRSEAKGGEIDSRLDAGKALRAGAEFIAERIVNNGLKKTANGELHFPYIEIGALRSVDRREIEGFQSIRGLMHRYVDGSDNKPLCLAVFGPPGSGKSMAMKQIARCLAEESSRMDGNPIELNLSGFTDISGLTHGLHQSRDRALTGKVPLVLVDEFDSSFGGQSLGWLKYLLAPMQDGQFREGDLVYNVGSCILVFIGGTRRTFQEFAGQLRNQEFIEAKGPDFVSRLRGHVNVRGINQIDENDELFVIRRAVALRYQLEKKFGKEKDKRFLESEIDSAVLEAFLTIDRFHHGMRSLEQIIQTCDTTSPQRQLTRSSLPPIDQLDMHVDAARFLDLIARAEAEHRS